MNDDEDQTAHGPIPDALPDDYSFDPGHEFDVIDALAWCWRHHATISFYVEGQTGDEALELKWTTPETFLEPEKTNSNTQWVPSPTRIFQALRTAAKAARAASGLE